MSKIHKIFFPSDFSETAQNAFRYCLLLADAYGAEIHLLHVVYPEYEMLDLPVMSVKATRDKIEFAQSALSSFTELTLSQVREQYTLNHIPQVEQEVEKSACWPKRHCSKWPNASSQTSSSWGPKGSTMPWSAPWAA